MNCSFPAHGCYVPPIHMSMVLAMPPLLETEEVLQIASEASVKLLDRVSASLNVDRARDVAWDALAAERDAELESGQVVAVPVEQALARLRAELQ